MNQWSWQKAASKQSVIYLSKTNDLAAAFAHSLMMNCTVWLPACSHTVIKTLSCILMLWTAGASYVDIYTITLTEFIPWISPRQSSAHIFLDFILLLQGHVYNLIRDLSELHLHVLPMLTCFFACLVFFSQDILVPLS